MPSHVAAPTCAPYRQLAVVADLAVRVYAAAASVMATRRLQGLASLEAQRAALADVPVVRAR